MCAPHQEYLYICSPILEITNSSCQILPIIMFDPLNIACWQWIPASKWTSLTNNSVLSSCITLSVVLTIYFHSVCLDKFLSVKVQGEEEDALRLKQTTDEAATPEDSDSDTQEVRWICCVVCVVFRFPIESHTIKYTQINKSIIYNLYLYKQNNTHSIWWTTRPRMLTFYLGVHL